MTVDVETLKAIRGAIKEGNKERVAELIGSNEERLNVMTAFGTWLHVAASHGKLDIANWLIQRGIDVNRYGGIAEGGALHCAASDGHLELVRCLIENGADLDVSEPNRNPLFGAIYNGHTVIARLLVESGIDTSVMYTGSQMKNMDALAFAREWGRADIVAMLSGDATTIATKALKKKVANLGKGGSAKSAGSGAGHEVSLPKTDSFKKSRKKASSAMNSTQLRKWLSRSPEKLVEAIAKDLAAHTKKLGLKSIDYYGYAILPGEPNEIGSLVVAYNGVGDISVGPKDKQYRYYKYSVDEWKHYEQDRLKKSDKLIAKANAEFAASHVKESDDGVMDEFEIAHSEYLLSALLQGMERANAKGSFGASTPFLAIWIPDSGHEILPQSVRRLNPPRVVRDFLKEFG